MNKDELNEREYIGGKKRYYWHATEEHCSIDHTMNKDELNEREYIEGKKNYYWHVVDYYYSNDNSINKDHFNEREYIQGKKNHYWHAIDDNCSRVNGSNMCGDRHHCNSKCNVGNNTEETEGTITDGFESQLRVIQCQLQNEAIVPLESAINATENFQKVLELATGEYINLHGDYDVMFLHGVSNFYSVKRGSKNITGITEMIIKNDDVYKNFNDKEKFLYSNLKHMYIQLEMLKNNSNYSILNGPVSRFDCALSLFSRYNFVEAFMKNHIDILYSFDRNGLTSSEIKYQKHFLLFILLPFTKWVINLNMPLSSDRIIQVFTEYYWDELYFEEKLAELKSILALKR